MLKDQKQLISVFFFALLCFVIYQLYLVFGPFFDAFFWSAILTFAFYPIYQKLSSRLGKPALAAGLTTLLIGCVVVIPSIFILTNLVTQILEVAAFVAKGGLQPTLNLMTQYPMLEKISTYAARLGFPESAMSEIPLRLATALANVTTAHLASAARNMLTIFFNFVIAFVLLFFMIRDGEKIYLFIYNLTPFEKKERDLIFSKINDTFASVIRGQFLTSLAQGFLAGLAFLFLGLPAPHFIGFATAIASLIPVIGASAVWLPFSVYLFFQQDYMRAVALLLVGIFLISLIDNVLKPAVIGERMKIPVFLLFFGILGGLKTYGVTGMFLGPLLITLFFALIQIYQEKYQ